MNAALTKSSTILTALSNGSTENMVYLSNYATYQTNIQQQYEPSTQSLGCVSSYSSTNFKSLFVQTENPLILHLKTTIGQNICNGPISSAHMQVSSPITSAIFVPTIDVHKEISIENCHYRKDKIYKDSIYYRCKDKECKGRIVLNKGIYTLTIPHACNNKAYKESKNLDSKKCIIKKKSIRIFYHDGYKFKERYCLKDSHYLVCATKKCSARAIFKDGIITAKQNHTEDCLVQIKREETRKKSSPERSFSEEISSNIEPLNELVVAKLPTDTISSSQYTLNNQKSSPMYVLSKRGTRMLYFDRYLYVKYKVHKNKTYYRCYESKCKVRGSVINQMFQCDNGHDHPDHQHMVPASKHNPIKLISNESMDNGVDGLAQLLSAAQSLENDWQELLTQKNKVLLYKDNYLYLVNRTVCDKVYYKCKRPRCPSRAVKKDGKLTVTMAHNHPDDIKAYHNYVFVSTLKDILSKNVQLSKQELYYRELAKLDSNIAGYIKPYVSICRTLQRASNTHQHTTLNHNPYCHHPFTATTLTQNPLF